jgi:hypothetical protein
MSEQLRKAIEEATRVGHYSFDFGPMAVPDRHYRAYEAKLLRVIELLVRQRDEYIRANWEHSPDELNEIAEMKLRDAELIAALEGKT